MRAARRTCPARFGFLGGHLESQLPQACRHLADPVLRVQVPRRQPRSNRFVRRLEEVTQDMHESPRVDLDGADGDRVRNFGDRVVVRDREGFQSDGMCQGEQLLGCVGAVRICRVRMQVDHSTFAAQPRNPARSDFIAFSEGTCM